MNKIHPETDELTFRKKIRSLDWKTIVLLFLVFVPLVRGVVGIIACICSPYCSHSKVSQSGFDAAMLEYEWDLFQEAHENQIRDTVKSIALRFPSVANSHLPRLEERFMDMLHEQYIEKGKCTIDGNLKILDHLYDTVFSPGNRKVCSGCGFKEGPTIGDFIRASSAPDFRSDGSIGFPFKLRPSANETYSGAVILYPTRIAVVAGYSPSSHICCSHPTRIDFVVAE